MRNTSLVFAALFSVLFLNISQASASENRFLIYPLISHVKVTCSWGCYDNHKGTDYGVTTGTVVIAVAEGRVSKVVNSFYENEKKANSFGNYVVIQHSNGYSTIYAHLQSIKVDVGDGVKQGDIIATSDNNGFSSGPHLHFEVRKDNQSVDPYRENLWILDENGEIAIIGKSPSQLGEINPPSAPSDENSESVPQPQNIAPAPTPWYQNIFNWFQNTFEYVVGQVAGDEDEMQEQSQAPVPPPLQNPVVAGPLTWEAQYIDQSPYPNLEPGKTALLKVRFRNSGTATWDQNSVSLNIVNSNSSPLYHASWVTQKRPARLSQKLVAPGQIGEFIFTIQAPANSGVYRLAVRPVFEQNGSFQWLGKDFGVYWLITVQSQLHEITTNLQSPPVIAPHALLQVPGAGSDDPVPVYASSSVATPIITQPSAESELWYTATSTIVFGGTKSATTTSLTIIHNDSISEINNFTNPNNWESLIDLVLGENRLEVIAVDQNGNLSAADSLLITVDGVAPEAPIMRVGKFSSSSVQIILYPQEASLSYDIRYTISLINNSNWDLASSTSHIFTADATTSTQSFVINNVDIGNDLKFYARVYDRAGNVSELSAPSSIVELASLGELHAFMVTPNSLNIQWQVPALQVISDNPIFEMYISTSTINDINFIQGVRHVSTRAPQTSIFSTSEFIQLNHLQSNMTYYVATRYSDGVNFSDFVYGDFTTTQNHSLITSCGPCSFREDVLLSKDNSPYIVTGDVSIFPEISLTIEPGVIVKFYQNSGIEMFGRLAAVGTVDNPITFTSIADDQYGGDTNQDNSNSSPSSGDWEGLYVDSLEGESATLDYVVMRYGGDSDPMLSIGLNAEVSISNSKFSYAQETAVHLLGDDQVIRVENNYFHDNSRGMLIDFTTDTEITHNDFRNNHYHSEDYFYDSGGLAVYYGDVNKLVIKDNNFINNDFWGFALDEGQEATLINNYFGSNEGPLIINYDEIWNNPGGYNGRGARDLVTEGVDYSNFANSEIAFH